jgi:hypothetical protein
MRDDIASSQLAGPQNTATSGRKFGQTITRTVTRRSILYKHCALMGVEHIQKNLREGFFTYEPPASKRLFEAIMAGLHKSPFAEPWARAYVEADRN